MPISLSRRDEIPCRERACPFRKAFPFGEGGKIGSSEPILTEEVLPHHEFASDFCCSGSAAHLSRSKSKILTTLSKRRGPCGFAAGTGMPVPYTVAAAARSVKPSPLGKVAKIGSSEPIFAGRGKKPLPALCATLSKGEGLAASPPEGASYVDFDTSPSPTRNGSISTNLLFPV